MIVGLDGRDRFLYNGPQNQLVWQSQICQIEVVEEEEKNERVVLAWTICPLKKKRPDWTDEEEKLKIETVKMEEFGKVH